MSSKKILLTLVVVCFVILALGIGLPFAELHSPAQASTDTTLPYLGRLADAAGVPVPDGAYDFAFTLYITETGGAPIWSEVQSGVYVQGGNFQAQLGAVKPLPSEVTEGSNLWLEVAVRGPEEANFTTLSPRQLLNEATSSVPEAASAAVSAAPSCPHDHVGEEWTANIAWSKGAFKIWNYGNGPSIWGWNGGGGNGIRGYATGNGLGVYGESQNSSGVVGRSTNGRGVEGYSINDYGIFANSTNDDSIHVDGAGQHALNIQSSGYAAIYVGSSGGSGVYVNSASGDGVSVYSATFDGVWINTAGDDGVHVNPTVGGVCYRCGWGKEDGFVVRSNGEARSDAGFSASSREFAVMMEVAEDMSAYVPGEVLVASGSGEGTAERSMAAYSPAVVGVYSASPGFLGGQPVADAPTRSVPVVIMGVVSCKVSAENGAIQPGDLLVTSSNPGFAMRADSSAPRGTILGKALQSLGKGTGTILILVTLQ